MKGVAKASAEWKDVINKENLFLITFGFHWKQMYGKVTATAFANKMREELKAWTNRQRSVRGVESTPAKARSPIPADRVDDAPSSLTGKRDPSLPAIATLPSAMGSVATPAPMDMAGPSTNRWQVSRQEADDRRMVENLEAVVIVRGNPGVFQLYPYPTLHKPLPLSRVQVFSGFG